MPVIADVITKNKKQEIIVRKILLLSIIILMSGCAPLQTPEETNIAVSALLGEIQIAINEIDKKTKVTSLSPFKYAELKLSTKSGKTDEGKASLVLSGKKSKTTTDSNTITLELVPNPKTVENLTRSNGHEIANYVIAAVTAIDENNYLKLKTLTVESGLEVVKTAGGGIEVELVGVSVTGGRTATSTNGNILKLVFGYPDKKEK